MNTLLWIGGAILLLTFLEAWASRKSAQRAAEEAESLRVELGMIRQYLEHRLDAMDAAISQVEYAVRDRDLTDLDPSEAP